MKTEGQDSAAHCAGCGRKGAGMEKKIDMTKGGIIAGVVAFAVPLLIGNLFQQLYSMVDSIVVGNFDGHTALSAVGTAAMPAQVLTALFLGIGTGAGIMVSQYMGAGDMDSIRRTLHTGNGFLLACSLPLTVLGVLAAPWVLRFMNVPDEAFGLSQSYLAILLLGTVASLGYNMNAGVLRGMGDSRSPLYFLIFACVVNIVLDVLFVAVFHLSAAGVGAATVIAQFSAWFYSIWHIRRKYPELDLRLLRFSVDRGNLRQMIRLGLPIGFNNAVFSLGFVLLNSLINQQGTVFMAGVTAASRVDNLIFLPIASFGAAATTFAGQNVGALQIHRLKEGFRKILLLTLGVNIALGAIILLLGKYALYMFTQEPEVIAVGLQCMWWLVPGYSVYVVFNTCCCFMNGAGEVRVPTLSSLLMFWGVRIPAAYLLFDALGRDYIYGAYPISWVAGVIIAGSYYLSGRWKRHFSARLAEPAQSLPE